jgi:hypothetical protein
MRTELLSAITTATAALTQFGVSRELPWEQNGEALFRKNLKKVYVDQSFKEESTIIPTLDHNNVLEDKLICRAYMACDAKNTPSQLDQLISNILACKDSTGIVNFITESDYTLDKQEDVLVLTFEFRLQQIKQ